jgi:hypothetical protein
MKNARAKNQFFTHWGSLNRRISIHCMKTLKTYFLGMVIILSMFSCYSQETNKIVSDVIMMSEADVSTDVIRTYIQNTDAVLSVSPTDIILLTKHGVKGDLIQFLITRNGEARKVSRQVVENRSYMESYDFFKNNYLMPRARYFSQRSYPPYAPGGFNMWRR